MGDVLRRNLDEPPSESASADEPEPASPEVRSFARALVEGVLQHRDELDRLIVKSAPSWPIDQMSRIDKSILRVAIFEILFDNRVPMKAAINEAVELAKRFGSDSSSRFINGVLGTVADNRQAWAPKMQGNSKAQQPASEPLADRAQGIEEAPHQ